ncbi:MAG: OsmC family protein [Acidobacteriota bacterium]
MIEVNVKHEGGVKFEIETRGHKLVSDQPAQDGGTDQGMTPPEIFLGGLASCAAYYAAAYLKKKKLERPGVHVRVRAEKVGPPAHLDSILIEVDVPGPLSDADRAGIEDSVHRCLIHQTMLRTPTIEIELNTPVSA